MFDICDNGPSCLHRSNVTLLKNTERTNVSFKIHNDELSNFFLKCLVIKVFFNKMLNYVTPASTVDDSTLFTYCISAGFVRLMGKIFLNLKDSYKSGSCE